MGKQTPGGEGVGQFRDCSKKGGSNLDRFSDTAAPTLTGCWTSLQHEELNFLKVYNYTTFFSWNILLLEDVVLIATKFSD